MDMRSEPAVIVGTITAFVTAAIGLLVAFGLDITDQQQNAILSLVAVIAPVIAGVIIRSKVYAPDTVREIVNDTQGPPAPSVNWSDPATWPSTPHGASEYGSRDGDA